MAVQPSVHTNVELSINVTPGFSTFTKGVTASNLSLDSEDWDSTRVLKLHTHLIKESSVW